MMHKSVVYYLRNERNELPDASEFPTTEQLLKKSAELNLDSVFIQDYCTTTQLMNDVRKANGEDVDIYTLVTVFNKHTPEDEELPETKAVEWSGKVLEDGTTGYCPTSEVLRERCLNSVKKLIELEVDGIWLDSLRYSSTHWANQDPNIMDTCYCDRCLALFEELIGEPIEGTNLEEKYLHIDGSYYHEWLEFKSENVASMAREVRTLIDDSGKDIKLGFFAVPWEDREFGAGIKRIAAQDFGKLAEIVDVVSPMLYHKMVGKDVTWIKDMIEYFWQVGKPFLPLIQTENIPTKLPPEEFKQALEFASDGSSMGVCVFFLDDLIRESEKYNIVKSFFG
jgi:uncharacterized lipoprotein YddW (UPF0748 family)